MSPTEGNDIDSDLYVWALDSPKRRYMMHVCDRLGERHVSVRKVQRVTGGSHRDVSAVVKLWRRRQREIAGVLSGKDSPETVQAFGAIVLAAIDQLRSDLITTGNSGELRKGLQHIATRLDEQRHAQQALAQAAIAMDQRMRSLTISEERLDRMLQKIEAFDRRAATFEALARRLEERCSLLSSLCERLDK